MKYTPSQCWDRLVGAQATIIEFMQCYSGLPIANAVCEYLDDLNEMDLLDDEDYDKAHRALVKHIEENM